MITKIYQHSSIQTVLRLVPPQIKDIDLKILYQERGLPHKAKGTCLQPLMQRKCHTPNQHYARTLAFDLLNTLNCNNLNQNQAKISLTHTKNAVAVAGTTNPILQSVGIDIEHQTRPLPKNLDKFFLAEEDLHTDLDRLPLWCLKEAALKCLDNFTHTLNLRQIHIKRRSKTDFSCHTAIQSCTGTIRLSSTGYYIATAWR